MDGMLCDGFQDAGDDCDSLRARLEQVESQLMQLPEWIKSEMRAEASEAIVAKAGEDGLHDDGSAAKTREDELAMVTAAVDTAVTKQLQAVESRCMKMIKGHEKRVDAEFVKLKEWQHEEGVKKLNQLSNMLRGA